MITEFLQLEFLQYDFILRAFQAGIIIAVIAPTIGIFLVLKRYSLIADTLSHVSLAGIAIGLILKINPIMTAMATTVLASLGIEKLRSSKKIYGESALSIFLSGSLALAIVLLGLGKNINANLFNYLFGSILTITQNDILIISILGIFIFLMIYLNYKALIFSTFDEEVAKTSGVKVNRLNQMLIILSALAISISIPIVGVLLIASLIVIPVVTALQLKKNFTQTLLFAIFFSVLSVIFGIILSFYLNTATGGTIVLLMLAIFLSVFSYKNINAN
jgi:zinc transport system permease protein